MPLGEANDAACHDRRLHEAEIEADLRRAEDRSLRDLYPDGRIFYGEDADPSALLQVAKNLGLVVSVTVQVPANRLGTFYRVTDKSGIAVGT